MNKLPKAAFLQVVQNAPLVSIDLILINEHGEIGLGLRRNEPAKGYYYFPGGRIFKDEKIEQTIGRVLLEELGIKRNQVPATICGVNNWFFKTNFAGVKGVTTHYVALAVKVKVTIEEIDHEAVESQHRSFSWMTIDHLVSDNKVHEDVKHVIRHLRDKQYDKDFQPK